MVELHSTVGPPRPAVNIERRQHVRYPVSNLDALVDERMVAQVVDVSRGGMQLVMAYEPPTGWLAPLEAMLDDEPFLAAARVVFVGPDLSGAPGTYRVGVRFEGPAPDSAAALEAFLERCAG